MTLLFCDGMDSYGATADLPKKWNSNNSCTFNATAGNYGGGAVLNGTFALSQLVKNFSGPSSGQKIRVGFWFKQASTPGGQYSIWNLTSGAGSDTWLFVDSSGHVQVCQLGSIGGVVLVTGAINVCDNAYHWIEVEVTLASGATGSATLYVDAILEGTATSVQTLASGSYQPITGGGPRWTSSWVSQGYMDDIIVWDDQGASFNTFPLGKRRIGTVLPNGAGSSTQWTPSAGNNYACVNSGYNASTPNVSTSSTGDVDLYAQGGLAWSPATVNAVVMNVYGQDAGGGGGVVKAKVATTSTGTGAPSSLATGTNQLFQTPFYDDPAGGAWTASDVAGMEIGIES